MTASVVRAEIDPLQIAHPGRRGRRVDVRTEARPASTRQHGPCRDSRPGRGSRAVHSSSVPQWNPDLYPRGRIVFIKVVIDRLVKDFGLVLREGLW